MPYPVAVAIRNAFSRPRRHVGIPFLAAIFFFAIIISCSSAPPTKRGGSAQGSSPHPGAPAESATDIRWTLHSARRQSSFVPLNLPVITLGMRITLAQPTGDSAWIAPSNANSNFALFTTRIARSEISGPAVEQLTGFAQTSSDAGSHLVKLPTEKQPADSTDQTYTITSPFPLYLQVDVSPLQDPGDYVLPISIAFPNRPAERAGLKIHVSDVALPTEPRILAVATTTTADLARMLPDSFAAINAIYLDRADPDMSLAVEQLDSLVRAARKKNLALFVEDIAPRIRVDNVGRVSVDWNTYDRLIQPYMDGSAFEDRIPLSVWLAPLPPRRISDSPTQLRQYIAACAQHFTEKGWTATPAFLHPALVKADADPQLRDEIAKTLRLHMTRDFLAVTTPEAPVPQPRLWTIDDSDPRLPPAGALATEQSVRVWPWVCAARSGTRTDTGAVRGFVWRNALERSDFLPPARSDTAAPQRPLLVLDPPTAPAKANPAELSIVPSLRMVWLNEGLNDTALLGLLEQRTDRDVIDALFAGIVGRTGVNTAPPPATASSDIPLPAPGYLYASWPEDRSVWDRVPSLLEQLLARSTPGQNARLSENDPAYVAAQVWLAKSRRPVARLAGFGFAIRPGRDGDALLVTPHLLAENPVGSSVTMDARFPLLPGDLNLVSPDASRLDRRTFDVPPLGVAEVPLSLAGFIDAFDIVPPSAVANSTLEITERHGGALLQLPVQLPVYRTRATGTPLAINAHADEWPADTTIPAFGPMPIATRYLSRPDLLAGATHTDPQPALARWTYDDHFLYALIQCPQPVVSDERNNDWPTQLGRWWGTDGVQLQIASAADTFPSRIIQLAFKPGGPMLGRTLTFTPNQPLQFTDTLPPNPASGGGGGLKYAITLDKADGRITGYTLEVAIPRSWFAASSGAQPAWRVNVLRHRADTLTSTSWSGPLVNDQDLSQMGLLLGQKNP